MKRASPMQMRKKEVKPDPKSKADKKGQQPKSAMERYAQERAAKAKAAKVPPMVVEMHDPLSDMHTLARAAEIRRDSGRHRAAKNAAKQRIKDLTDVAE